MGDYTQMQLMIHDCPDGEAWALSEVLHDRALRVDWDGPTAERGVLHLGEIYTDRSVTGTASQEIAEALIEAAPGATFIVWTDPAYEWLGAMVRYTPELGRHDADCTAEGSAVFAEQEICDALAKGREALDALLGTAWTTALTHRAEERTIRVQAPDEEA